MMLHPSIDRLMELHDIDSKYTLVAAAAKRARHLQTEGLDEELDNESKPKYVGIALKEIANRKVKIVTQPEQQQKAKK